MAESDADTLRRAAALLRERWEGRPPAPPDAFVLAVADWLDFEARTCAATNPNQQTVRGLAVARAYLDESA